MSLVHLSNLCSHLTHASKARLGLTSVPNTNLHLRLLLALQSSGIISSVIRGGPSPPPPHLLLGHPAPQSSATQSSRSAPGSFDAEQDDDTLAPLTRENVASRRLWLGLKYWNNEPVLGKLKMESKPTRRIWMNVEGLRDVVRGRKSGYIEGLRNPGECLFVSTDKGVLEARECVERKIGGMVLCRVL
jgi:ribosomal protein S8